ncbi:MAG: MMPL family transporter [Alistipes sp.]|nr:MMPL family transporter [Candidatus Minthomonas equi]
MTGISEIFDFLSAHKPARRWSLIILTSILATLASTLHFSEDITDFLPLMNREREQLSIYQDISGADRIIITFSNNNDEERTIQAIDRFISEVKQNDSEGWFSELSGQFDTELVTRVAAFVYANAPYFLTEADIERADSLLSRKNYIEEKLFEDRQMLIFPSSSFLSFGISRDPLGLFTPVISRLNSSGSDFVFESRNGYIFTPDLSRGIVFFNSPFGNSETNGNTKLISSLHRAVQKTSADYPDIIIDVSGGPAIAVSNSDRIKSDSIVAIGLSVILIIFLLASSFKSIKNISLIFLSIAWGLLFAFGGLALFRDKVSVIVIGISSVILGIAVNYPLHLIAHSAHQSDRKKALNEIKTPLITGNITTVGAFLALVPLKSVALRDLGLFASLLLVGTILFVIFFLPHYIAPYRQNGESNGLIRKICSFSPERNRYLVIIVAAITIILCLFSTGTRFDTNLSHINYMTELQRKDMQYFEDILTKDENHHFQTVYIYSKGSSFNDALTNSEILKESIDKLEKEGIISRQNQAGTFIVSKQEQDRRLAEWKALITKHREVLTTELKETARRAAFSESAFDAFYLLIDRSFSLESKEFDYFAPLTETIFIQNFSKLETEDAFFIIDPVNVEPTGVNRIKEVLKDNCFDVEGMNGGLARNLSENFNYIGWVCSLIVFLFLWYSFGRLELAIISFIPMAVSWIWILGIMSLLGIQFNIINIILATFIFGQGDDYTIFMTEGCLYEFSRKKKILSSYKQSILESAAIMFVGIGTLITAKHPALRSLSEITIIGMSSVMLMAYMIPPLLFNWLTGKDGKIRRYPITLRFLIFGLPKNPIDIVKGRYLYKGKEIEKSVSQNFDRKAETVLNTDLSEKSAYEMEDTGYGELAILLALKYPGTRITATVSNEEKLRIAEVAAEDFVSNIEFKL